MIQDDNQFFHSLSFVSRSTHRLLDTVKKTEIEQPANGFPLEFGKMIMMVLSMLRRSGNLPILFDDVKQGEKTLSYVSGLRLIYILKNRLFFQDCYFHLLSFFFQFSEWGDGSSVYNTSKNKF
ncbi:hypothetical protein HanHA300_Chr11g0423721 [Helianthus annuus]|nr:hypothetical protein HanHA300_Chr11g0423721 [Helianthus annuus]